MGDIYTNPPQSRNEALVKAIIDGTEYTDPPQSRNEAILKSIIDGTEYTAPPQSRMEDLLIQLKDASGGGEINLIETVPTFTGSMTYDGTEQTATFTGYDADKMTVSGNTATNAGTYTAKFKPKKGYYWNNGDGTATNEEKSVSWSIAKVTVTIPTYSGGTLTYDGTEQTAQFSDYEPDYMTVSGNSATNAGDYTAVFSLLDAINYEWSDTTTADKSVSWSIAKATASITLSANSATLNAETTYTDITITAKVGTGALSVVSSDTTVATVGDIENDSFRITANNDEKSGNATVTVSMAESENYTSASATVAVNVQYVITEGVFGVYWDGLSANLGSTKLTRTDDASNLVDPVAYVNNGNGSSPFDKIMPWAGIKVVQDEIGGELVEIPKFWLKITRTTQTDLKVKISPTELDGYFVSPAHQDRGDGQGERDFVYVGRYITSYDSEKRLHNSNNLNVTLTSPSGMKSNIEALGNEFAPLDIMTLWTIRLLYLVEFADWNSQATIGNGMSSYNQSKYRADAQYHTGTSAAERASDGFTQYRYIKNVFDTYTQIAGMWEKSRTEIYLDKQPMRCFTSANTISETATKIYTASNYIAGSANPFNFQIIPNYEWLLIPDGQKQSGYIPDSREWHYTSNPICMYAGWYGSSASSNGMFSEKNELSQLGYNAAFYRIQKLPNAS